MVACETCWGDAYLRSRLQGGSQVDHYKAILLERANDPEHTEYGVPAIDAGADQ